MLKTIGDMETLLEVSWIEHKYTLHPALRAPWASLVTSPLTRTLSLRYAENAWYNYPFSSVSSVRDEVILKKLTGMSLLHSKNENFDGPCSAAIEEMEFSVATELPRRPLRTRNTYAFSK